MDDNFDTIPENCVSEHSAKKRYREKDSVYRMQRQHARKQTDRPGRNKREQCYSCGGEYPHKGREQVGCARGSGGGQ